MMFDVYVKLGEERYRWLGMAEGDTPKAARDDLMSSMSNRQPHELLMLPFYGCGTTEATFEALMGIPFPVSSKVPT